MISQARLTLPPPSPGLLERRDLDRHRDRPVVVLSAGAGFGKSQLLYRWAGSPAEGRKTIYGLCSRLGETASSLLELLFAALGQSAEFRLDRPWAQQVDPFLQLLFEAGPLTVILDDLHHCESELSDAQDCLLLLGSLLDYRPPECQLILSGRRTPSLPELEMRCLQGDLVLLRAPDLALSPEQLEELAPGHGPELAARTSGWPMAAAVLAKTPPEQWGARQENLAEAMLQMTCGKLNPAQDRAVKTLALMGSARRAELACPEQWELLVALADEGVLVWRHGADRLALHPMFAEQLAARAEPDVRERAVQALRSAGRTWEALERLEDPDRLRSLLLEVGQELLESRRWRLLEKLIERAAEHPTLLRWRGVVAWRLGDPSSAIEAFRQAASSARAEDDLDGEARAYLAAGELYLDAVCPSEAEQYLKRAYRCAPPGGAALKAQLAEMLAENALNRGRARQSLRYRRLAARWGQSREEDLPTTARLMLRSGRLSEARSLLETALAQAEKPAEQAAERAAQVALLDGHRDPRLVLSYLSALTGDHLSAASRAQEVLDQAVRLEDRRTEAVALTRLAHAGAVRALAEGRRPGDEELEPYLRADSLYRTLGVERLRAEGLMGQALLQARRGNIPKAYQAAREGVEVTRQGGDLWMQSWLEFVQAVAALEGEHPGARELLSEAREAFRRCRDRFGYALSEAWLALAHEADLESRGAGADPGALLRAVDEFPALELRPGLFSPPLERLQERLAEARSSAAARGPEAGSEASLEGAGAEPPKRLEVFCLGSLSLLRNGEPIPAKAFKRKKARELLALLLAAPDSYFHREDLAATLWPDSTQKAALRDFRVALHALSEALDPDRPKNSSAFCIDRQEERYRLLSEHLELDTRRFEELVSSPNERSLAELERGLKLYRGPFCEDYPYLAPLDPVRRQLDLLYLGAAERIGELYLEHGLAEKAAELSTRILAGDPTWEPAYRVLMKAQAELGHDHLLPRTFTRCLETLEAELGVEPSAETFDLARELLGDQLATIL